ncbi:hypothetical protein ACLB2K_046454 [Fragaria x ananassa]
MSPSKLQAFYNAIDVFVNPTLRPQGLDLTLMEAMMSGKPVMASRFRSIKGRIVFDDEFGFMFAPNVASLLEALELAVKEGSRSLNNFSRKFLQLTWSTGKAITCKPKEFGLVGCVVDQERIGSESEELVEESGHGCFGGE